MSKPKHPTMPPSNHHLDEAVLHEVSLLCGVDTGLIDDVYGCTPFQRGIAADSSYVQRFVLTISADLDTADLSAAIGQVVALNQVLRTRIVDSQQLGLVQVVLHDDPATSTRRISTGLAQFLEEERATSMDLAAPLFRSTIVQDAQKWVLSIHHAICDQFSLIALVDDVTKIYCKQKPSFHTPFKQFVDYCGSIRQSEAKDFWMRQFPDTAGTPSIFPSVPINRSVDASSRTNRQIRVPTELASAALIPAYLECAWAILAQAYSGGDSVAYGVVYSGRNETETTLGPTVVTLPAEVAVTMEDTVGELLKGRQLGRKAVQGSGAAMQMGLSNIRKVSESAKRASEFQTLLNFLHRPPPSAGNSPIYLDYEDDAHKAYAICLTFQISQERAVGLEVLAEFDESLVSPVSMNRLLAQLEHILQALARAASHTRIGELTLLSSRDRLETLKWNNSIKEPVNETLHGMVRKMAIAHPEDLAVDAWDGRLTYLELVTMADNLAETLRQRGVTRQSVVPCLFEFSRWAVVAALGVLKVGAVCMSLEPSHPRARHQKLLDLTKPHALLCSTALAEGAHGLAPLVFSVSAETVSASAELRDQPEDNDESEQNAYMIFTSGSTGTPKGVVLQHRALATSLTSAGRYVGWHHRLKALQFTSYIWDASIGEIFGTLIFGGCVCIPSAETRESGLADYINVVGVEWIFQTPAGMSNLSPHEIPTVKTLLTGGDRVQPESAMTWGSKLRLINAWGPCESSIYATFAELDPQARFPETIGRPVGCAVWIADPTNSDRLVPIGAVGELIIESTTVAKGYFENESATAAAFIDSPTWAPRRSPVLTKARRFYRTGDLGKYNDDGTIYFIGRRDHQVKINGQRLELGELEDVISQCSAVRAVAVVSHAPRGRHELVAILTIDDPQLPRKGVLEEHSDEHHNIVAESVDSARSFTAAKLPSYMLPAQWLVVRDLPRAASSKVDRQAIGRWLKTKEPLLSGTPDANDSQTRSVSPPVSAAEQTLRSIWSNVLDVPEDQIGRDSSFLRLSGDSITAMQVCTRLRRLGLQLSVQTLMQLATLSATAAECKEIPASAPHKVENHATGSKKTSLSPIQELFMRNDGPASHNQFNQSWLLQLNTGASDAEIKAALQRIVDMHPMLRAQFSQASAGHWEQSIAGASTESSWRFKSHSTSSSEDIRHIVNITQSSLDIKEGSVFAADLISAHSERLLFLAAHHLVCDIVSWRVILEDFENILTSPDELAEPTTSFTTWVEHETRAAASRSSLQQRPPRSADIGYWDIRHISLKVVDTVQERFSLEEKVTALLMGDPCNAPFATRPAELMLAATLSAFQEVFPDRDSPAVYSEGHGRGTRNDSLARTVGWFTTMYPVPVELRSRTPDHAVIATKDAYRSAQNVKWFRDQQSSCHPLQRTDLELLFNFAGHLPQANARDKMLNWRDPQDYGIRLQNIADEVEQIGLLSVFCFVQDRRLRFCIDYNKKMAHQTRIQQWIKAVERTLCQFADELPGRAPKLTVADVSSLNSVGDVDIDAVNSQLGELQIPIPSVETIYPCSAVQEGILFAQLKGQGDEYRDRFALRVTPTNPHATVSVQDLEQAWRSVCRAHPILRTVFTSGLDDATAFQQIVLRETEPMVKHKTLDGDLDILSFLQAYRKPTIPETMPPHCMTVVQNAADCSTHVVFDASHAIIDARSMHIMAMQLISAYQNPSPLPRGPSYSDYIVWTESRRKVSRQYWTSHLADQEPCLLPSKAVPRDDRPASLHFDVPFNKASALNSFCRQHGVTIASFAQVVWALVLKRHSVGAAHSPCFGCIHSGRDSIDAADRIMGPMISMLISRFDITSPSSTSPLDLMNQARQDSAEGSDKAGCSLGEIHEQLGLGTSLLFNTIMSIQPAWVEDLALKGSAVSMAFVQADDPTEYHITVGVAYSKESLLVRLTYKQEVVPKAFAEELAQYFAVVADALLGSSEQPLSKISILQDALQAPLPSTGASEGRPQYWTDHLSRVERASTFPSTGRAHRVLKDTVRSANIAVLKPSDQAWTRTGLQASWALCLSRLTGNTQVLFGVAVEHSSGKKSDPRQATATLVPYAVQITKASTSQSLSEDVRSWVQDCQPYLSEGGDYIRASRGELGSAGQVDNVLIVCTEEPNAKAAFELISSEQRLLPASSHPDDWGCGLAMSCRIALNGSISVQASFDSLLMDTTRADLILRQYEHCIHQLFENLDTGKSLASLDPISDGERSLMRQWSSKSISTADICIHNEISQRATALPHSAAVNAWDGEISYTELDDLSSRLAVHLVEAGVQVGTFVPFYFAKSTAAVVAMIAVMKSGGVFVPLDIKHPEQRRAVILAELNSPIALCSSSWRTKLGDLGASVKTVIGTDMEHLRKLPASKQPAAVVGLENICYVTYTSGSTGKPKGIIVDHSNIATSVRSYRLRLGMDERTRTLQYVALTFDVSFSDIFMTLLSGGCLFIPTEEEHADAVGIVQAINRTSANWLCLTPSLATLLQPEDVPTTRTLVLIGEAMRTDLVEAWADRVALVNAYAPSEASIEASCRLVRRNDMKTDHNNIGSPNDCLYWVVDENNHEKLVPIGCPGELLIQGPNITRGYLHNPEKTEAAFIKRPEWMRDYVGEAAMHRLYKTGDIVEQHADSSVTYLGRSDSQFKLRGQRVDVMDIEHNVRQHLKDEWQTAVDVVHWDQDGRDPSLVCFLAKVPSTDKYSGAHALLGPEPELATSVRAGLSLAVPVYMIPDFYIPLRDLPTAPSGKTDRKALRSIASSIPPNMLGEYTGNSKPTPNVTNGATQKRSSQGSCSPPQAAKPTDKFAAMQRAWGRVLNTLPSSIQRHDNWFSSGGNSIKAMQLVAAARKEGLKLTVADIFNNPVLEDLELVASFRPTEMSSQSKPLLQTRNESFFPRICAHYPFLIPGNIESAAMATDTQAWMLATGEVTGSGFWNEIYIDSKDGLDVARLTQACAEVTRHHPLMRTVFVQLEEALYQVVLKDQHAVSKQNPGFSRDVGPQEEATRKHIPCFSYENLSSDDRLCHRLRLTIHHALYDGILLQMISKDIDSAYCGRPLTAGLPFHTWIAQIGARDFTATKAFWKKTLLASSMTHLHPPSGPCRHESQTGFLRTSVPIGTLQSSAGTEASVLKAAWAIVLARELCLDDVVFGQVVANRSSSFLETDQVMGPCVNLLPVRVPLTQKKNFSQVVQEVHEQHRASVPHQDLGFRQVIRDCTAWPQWTRFGSCVVYQNFGSMIRESEGSKFHIGDVEVAWCGDAQPADSGDIWVIAQPEPDNHAVVIEIRYIPGIISTEQAERLARNLATVLETGRLDPPTISPTWSLVGGDSDGEISNPTSPGSPPSRQSQELVTKAWRETKLFRDDVLPQADVSMFDCDADIVSALLLSRFFQRHGCDFGVAEVVRNPTQRSQATWLGSPDTTSEPFAPEYTVRAVGTPAPAPTTRYDLSDVDLTQQDGYVANYAIFPLEQRSEIASIGAALETGLSETLAQVPLLAGRVLRDSAKRSYVLCRPQDTCELALRYLNDSFPSYEKLESTHFPPSMLPRALLLPLSMPSTTSIYEHEWGEEGVPCLFLQASFLKGGMILATAWHHQVSDARGVDIFLGLLAENTRAALGGHTPRPRTAYELNIDRTPFVAVGKGESEDEEIDHSGLPHQLGSLARQDPSRLADIAASGRRMGEVVSMLLHIPEEQAAALKKICTPAEPKDEFDFVSTYQCVATLLHRLIVRARLRTGCMQPNDATATIHAINMRGRAREVPPTYFGNAVAASLMTPMTASELVGEAGLQKGTLNSRHDIRSVSMHHIRRYAHAYATHGAATVMQAMAALMTTGTVVTSWQQMRLAAYDLGFGPPHAFRSPNFGVNGQVIIYPTLPGQGVVASITSRKGCISAMQEDSEFIRYAEVWDVDKVSK